MWANNSLHLEEMPDKLTTNVDDESVDAMEARRLNRWLATLVSRSGNDLLLVSGAPACIRIDGSMQSIETGALDGAEIEAAVLPALTTHALKVYKQLGIADSSYRVSGLGRFRINLHHEQGRAAAAIRALPSTVPTLSDLHLPASVQSLAHLPRGLVLIGGPAGSGKSTTLAALVAEINRSEARHVVLIEDPIEYEHRHIRTILKQVEIG